jgi:hypothetical protein
MSFDQFTYTKALGAYKPSFEGVPEDYYPLTKCEVFKYTLFVVGVITGVLGIMIGFIIWATNGLNNYIIVWSIVTLCFIIAMIILFYVGGRRRIRDEKILIE